MLVVNVCLSIPVGLGTDPEARPRMGVRKRVLPRCEYGNELAPAILSIFLMGST